MAVELPNAILAPRRVRAGRRSCSPRPSRPVQQHPATVPTSPVSGGRNPCEGLQVLVWVLEDCATGRPASSAKSRSGNPQLRVIPTAVRLVFLRPETHQSGISRPPARFCGHSGTATPRVRRRRGRPQHTPPNMALGVAKSPTRLPVAPSAAGPDLHAHVGRARQPLRLLLAERQKPGVRRACTTSAGGDSSLPRDCLPPINNLASATHTSQPAVRRRRTSQPPSRCT